MIVRSSGSRPARARALGQRRRGHLVEVAERVHRVDVDAVGHLARHAPHPRVDGGDVDGRIGGVEGAGHPRRSEERERPVVALEGELLLAAEGPEDGLHGADVLGQAGPGRVEVAGVAAHGVGAHLGTEPEPELAAGRLGQLPRRLGRDHRAARERHRHAGRQVEAGRGQRRRRDRQERGAARLGEHQPVDAGALHVGGEPLHGVQLGPTRHHIEAHRPRLRHPHPHRLLVRARTGPIPGPLRALGIDCLEFRDNS